MSRGIQYATLGTALGCGLSSGVFFAFSSFVMPALDRLPPAQSIAAMQSMNKLAVTPAFMTALFGTALASAGVGAWAVVNWDESSAPWVLAGSTLFLVGAIGVTIARNVPLNDGLATVQPHAADAAQQWRDFFGSWTAWNHVRTVASIGAAGLITAALTRMG